MTGAEKKAWQTRLEGMSIKENSRMINSKGKGASNRDSPNMSMKESLQLASPIVKHKITQSIPMSFVASSAQIPATRKKSSREIALFSSHSPSSTNYKEIPSIYTYYLSLPR